jgi:hypothetical protein
MGKYRVIIYDVNRKLLKDEVLDKNQVSIMHQVDVGVYQRGVYVIEFISPQDEKTTVEFIKM